MLKREGATVIVAITPCIRGRPALVEKFPTIDLIVGGHEHFLALQPIPNRA
jgi:hypothetical protein